MHELKGAYVRTRRDRPCTRWLHAKIRVCRSNGIGIRRNSRFEDTAKDGARCRCSFSATNSTWLNHPLAQLSEISRLFSAKSHLTALRYYDVLRRRFGKKRECFSRSSIMAWLLAFGENLIAQLANKVIWIMANNYSIKWPRYYTKGGSIIITTNIVRVF